MVQFLTTAEVSKLGDNALEQANFISSCSHFQLLSGQLYYLGDDGIMCLVVPQEDTMHILI